LTNEDTLEYLRLCRKAAKIAANGKIVDIEDVSQELFLWILQTKTITTPTYKGLLDLLVREARQHLMNQSRQHNPAGWSGMPWSVEEIREALRDSFEDLPPQITEAMTSSRMPEHYRAVLHQTYGKQLMPPKSSTLRSTMYRAVERLQEVINYPTDGIPSGTIEIGDLTDADEGRCSISTEDALSDRRRENSERGALTDRIESVRGISAA